jgi:uncharacterized membrane protein YraQ (UPF0718 family)/YHS domain-containing protein
MMSKGAFWPDVVESLKMSFFMLWETLWALVLGFGLSGVVQAFVPREAMERRFGNHRPKAIAQATGLGAVSSSCSYAATAMSKSLFQKGADFITSLVFMFSSTNLVLELGLVLFVLMGWQFMAAEFIGGPIMIVLLVVLGGFVFTKRLTDGARVRLAANTVHDHHHVADSKTKAGWADAARYALADLKMLRKELVIGYLIAGFITVFVSHEIWEKVFFVGHGPWTAIENVIVGPFIAIVSFVCSVGNVPLAAALWHGGLGFGGVVAFIFADLITLPLLLIYRKYYGTALTVRILLLFWAVMAVAGLAVHGLFSALDLVPAPPFHGEFVHRRFEWNYTTYLDFVFIAVFGVMLWLARQRSASEAGFAIDPVCGMQVQIANAPAHRNHNGTDVWFCADRCAERFDRDPDKYLQSGGSFEDMGNDEIPVDLGLTRHRHEIGDAEH